MNTLIVWSLIAALVVGSMLILGWVSRDRTPHLRLTSPRQDGEANTDPIRPGTAAWAARDDELTFCTGCQHRHRVRWMSWTDQATYRCLVCCNPEYVNQRGTL